MICPTCQAVVPAGDKFCSACGTATNGRGPIAMPPPDDPRTESLLAEANLLRMRGQWHDAETRCIDVMRLDPNNVHAHSLLGDIYRDQGKIEEAAQWYQMALDLDPSSTADKAKLAIMQHEAAQTASRNATLFGIPPIHGPSGASHPVGTQKLMGLSPVLWLRGLMVLSAAFVVAAVILIVAIRNGPRSGEIVPTGTIRGPGSSGGSGPSLGPPLPASNATNPAPAYPRSATNPSGPALNTGTHGTETARGLGFTSSGAYSQQELAIETYVDRQAGLPPGVQIASVTLDPREQRATLVLIHSETSVPRAPEEMRGSIAYEAFRAGQAAFTASPVLQRASVSVRVTIGGHVEPAFAGDLDRSMAASAPMPATAEQALAMFSGVWWAPSFSPSASSLGDPDAAAHDAGPGSP